MFHISLVSEFSEVGFASSFMHLEFRLQFKTKLKIEFRLQFKTKQVATMFSGIQAKLEALTQFVNRDRDKLGRVETRLKNRNEREEKHGPWTPYQRRYAQDPDDWYLKSIQLDVPTFDSRLNYSGSLDS